MLAQGKDNALLRYTLGSICLKEGSLDDAVGHLQEALRQDAGHTASWKTYAKALAELGRMDEARAAYLESSAAAAWLEARTDRAGRRRLLDRLGAGESTDDALRELVGMDTGSLDAAVQAWIQSEFAGRLPRPAALAD